MTLVPQIIMSRVEEKLHCKVDNFRPAVGGCINHGGQVITTKGDYFIKWNDLTQYPNMFMTEASGLNLLNSKRCINIPEVVYTDTADNFQFIVLEFVLSGHRKGDFWKLFGERLAALHHHSNPQFGLDHNNFIGSLPQHNTFSNSWVDFFIRERLEVQLQLAGPGNQVEGSLRKKFESLYLKLPNLFPEEKPSLLHGDLWSGNFLVNEIGEPCLIDPAVYYGHREAELAFTTLFGGFEQEFYEAYFSAHPVQPGFEDRIDLYNLYPLLVHANLFGGSYWASVKQILQRFI